MQVHSAKVGMCQNNTKSAPLSQNPVDNRHQTDRQQTKPLPALRSVCHLLSVRLLSRLALRWPLKDWATDYDILDHHVGPVTEP